MTDEREKWKEENDSPPPGSDEALNQGCICPVIDNGHGDGHYRGGYAITADCPLHREDN